MRKILICLITILFSIPTSGYALPGKVVSVAGGVTITVLDSSTKQHKIRLYGIDCSEKGQTLQTYTVLLEYVRLLRG